MKSSLTFWARSRYALMLELSWFVMWFNQPRRYHTYKVDEQQRRLYPTLCYENESQHYEYTHKTSMWHFMQFIKNWNTATCYMQPLFCLGGHSIQSLSFEPLHNGHLSTRTTATNHIPTANTTLWQWPVNQQQTSWVCAKLNFLL